MVITVERYLGHWYVLKDDKIIKNPDRITDAFKTKKEAEAFAKSLRLRRQR